MSALFVVMLFAGVVVSRNGFAVTGFDLVRHAVRANFTTAWYTFVTS